MAEDYIHIKIVTQTKKENLAINITIQTLNNVKEVKVIKKLSEDLIMSLLA